MANYKETTLKVLSIRVTPQQMERLVELKAEHGYSIQEIVRRALDATLWPKIVADPAPLPQLAEIPKPGVKSDKTPRKVAYR